MELKEAVKNAREIFIDIRLVESHIKAIQTLIKFCQSVLDCKGMPEKKSTPTTYLDCRYISGFNASCDLHQAWAAKILDVERIKKLIEEGHYYKDSISEQLQHFRNGGCDEKTLINSIAAAIVAGLKEGI